LNKGKIAIVGGSGFVGSSLARHFIGSFQVKILDNRPVPKGLQDNVGFEQCDVRSYDEVEKGLRDVEVVIHTAIVQIPSINENKRLGYEVNIIGTQNVCEAANRLRSIKGLLLVGSWHVIGERGLNGVINEEFGFRPDKVEDRARLYALCKVGQETITRIFDQASEKIYGVIRMGTMLGNGMPEKTAASIFIKNGLEGKPLTPYKHSMYRPMLYVSIGDACRAFEAYVRKIAKGEIRKDGGLAPIVNVYWPEPVTILELAEMVRDAIIKCSGGKTRPTLEVIDKGEPPLFAPDDKKRVKLDISKAKDFLGLHSMESPKETIENLVKDRIKGRAM
jgi:nucleoside-diphosphate-sugar epimerase